MRVGGMFFAILDGMKASTCNQIRKQFQISDIIPGKSVGPHYTYKHLVLKGKTKIAYETTYTTVGF